VSNWIIYNKKADFKSISQRHNISELAAKLIRNKDITDDKDIDMYINGNMHSLHNPYLLKDIEKGAAAIIDSIKKSEPIRIIGDYDVDGVCSTFILYKVLTSVSDGISYDIPDRITDGYGLNVRLIDKAYNEGVRTIITCDNGIAAAEQIAHARSLGMKVVVTDHHEVPSNEDGMDILPNANAVIDIKRSDDNYPYKEICGAVVAYKFSQVLLDMLGINKEFVDSLMNEYLLPFISIATVCDVMELKNENRVILKNGLKAIPNTSNEGLKALLNVNALNGEITPYHIGFILGPCINASGRLNSAMDALELFLSDGEKALEIASSLHATNEKRKSMTSTACNEAIMVIEENNYADNDVIVIKINCHESLAGIVAGKIKEKYNKPCIVFTNADGFLKGSARSIEAYDMYENLSKFKDLMIAFGGHKMAAGLSIYEKDLSVLRDGLNNASTLTDKDFEKKVYIDVAFPLSMVDEDTVDAVNLLEPFGNGNAKPLFATKSIHLISVKPMGKTGRAVKIQALDDEYKKVRSLVYFGDVNAFATYLDKKHGLGTYMQLECEKVSNDITLDICYQPDINEFRGRREVQTVIKEYR